MNRTDRIARRFDAAASSYGEASAPQKRIADALAEDIIAANLPPGARVLELGCGDGWLTRRLAPVLQPAEWIASDIAPAMLTAVRAADIHPAVRTQRLDAAAPDIEPGFDLVCSSLALQWMAVPRTTLEHWRRLVRPGGLLAFSTLLDGTFAEWRAALAQTGVPEPEPILPSGRDLALWAGAEPHELTIVEQYRDGLDFLRVARRAGIDASLNRALDAGRMRRAINIFQSTGARLTYRAALIVMRA